MFTKVLFYLSLMLFVGTSVAQVPGYLGKRTLVIGEWDFSPALTTISLTDAYIHSRIGFEVGHILTRATALGANIQHLTTRFEYDYFDVQTNQRRIGNARLSGTGVGLNFQFYNLASRGNIAPLGRYEKLEIVYLRYGLSDLSGDFFPDGNPDLGNYSDLILSMTFGSRWILSDLIVVQAGIQFAYATGVFRGQQSPESQYLKQQSAGMLKGHFAANLQLGIGFIIF